MIRYTGERAIPWNRATGLSVMHPHIMRYAWATRHVWGKNVVDLGCGAGYGAYILSMFARSVVGVDASQGAIDYARLNFSADNLSYEVGDITEGIPEAEVYTCFEVIEHLADPALLLNRIKAPLVWSIPIEVRSKWHKWVYSLTGIIDLMKPSDFRYQNSIGDISENGVGAAYVLGVRG